MLFFLFFSLSLSFYLSISISLYLSLCISLSLSPGSGTTTHIDNSHGKSWGRHRCMANILFLLLIISVQATELKVDFLNFLISCLFPYFQALLIKPKPKPKPSIVTFSNLLSELVHFLSGVFGEHRTHDHAVKIGGSNSTELRCSRGKEFWLKFEFYSLSFSLSLLSLSLSQPTT